MSNADVDGRCLLPAEKTTPAGVNACRKCGGAMKPGKAIPPALSTSDEGTVSEAAHTAAPPLADCMKCEACGWSVTSGVQGRCARVGEPCECAPEARSDCVSWRPSGVQEVPRD